MSRLLFPDAVNAARPTLKRGDSWASQTSLPTPPDTLEEKYRHDVTDSPTRVSRSAELDDPFAATHTTPPSSFSRPRTNRPRHADRITKQAASAYREHTAAMNAAWRQDPDNPFLERPGETFKGKRLQAREMGVVNYVFRGKRIAFDTAYYAPGDVCLASDECPPRLLFPSPERSPERFEPMPTPKKPLSPPRLGPVIPPTPESLHKINPHAFRRFHPYAHVSSASSVR